MTKIYFGRFSVQICPHIDVLRYKFVHISGFFKYKKVAFKYKFVHLYLLSKKTLKIFDYHKKFLLPSLFSSFGKKCRKKIKKKQKMRGGYLKRGSPARPNFTL